MKCFICKTQKDFYNQVLVRSEVFLIEQNVPIKEEIDELDTSAVQFIAYDNDKPVGAARFRVVDHKGKIERVCVLKDYRRKGVGKIIMENIENYALTQGINYIMLNAQISALPFYRRLGYQEHGEIFLDAGIEHKMMDKRLTD